MYDAPIVFFDIAGPDLQGQRQFFADVLGWESALTGQVSVRVQSPRLNGFLRTDPASCVIYFGVLDVTKTVAKVVAAGGTINAPRFEVKGVVVLGLFSDPAGNHLGLVEMNGDQPKIP